MGYVYLLLQALIFSFGGIKEFAGSRRLKFTRQCAASIVRVVPKVYRRHIR